MNSINTTDLKQNGFFTADSFIFEKMFFLPKNTVLKDYHIRLLNRWTISSVATEGALKSPGEAIEVVEADTATGEEVKDNSVETGLVEESSLLEDVFDNMANIVETDLHEEEETTVEPASIDVLDSYKDVYKRWIVSIMNFFNDILNNKNIDKQKVINLLFDIEDFINRDKNSALMLFGETFEGVSYVYKQTIETVILSVILAKSAELSDFAKTNLVIGTLFHDLGMLKVPRAILEKKGALTKEEIIAVQNHTLIGYRYLRDVKYSAIIASGALQHHERIDGKGYPAHIKEDKITTIGKIVAVVDAYCAAISNKPFRNPLHAKDAVQDLLKKGGTLYDAKILKEFVKNISFYPIGSLILLSNNEIAKVIGTSGVAMKPIVQIINIHNHDTENSVIDLTKRTDIYVKGIYRDGSQG